MLLESVALEVHLLPRALSLSLRSVVTQQQLSRMEKLRVRDAGGPRACPWTWTLPVYHADQTLPGPSRASSAAPGSSTCAPSPHPYSEALCRKSPSTTALCVEAQILVILRGLMETTLLSDILP